MKGWILSAIRSDPGVTLGAVNSTSRVRRSLDSEWQDLVMRLQSLGCSWELDGLRAAPSRCLFEFAFCDL